MVNGQNLRHPSLADRPPGVSSVAVNVMASAPFHSLSGTVTVATWLTMLTVNALAAATHVIAPVEPKHLSLVALVSLVEMVEDVRKEHNGELELAGVAPFRVQRTRLARECLEDLKRTFGKKMLPPVRESARVAEAPGFHLPVSHYDPDSIGAEDFAALTKAVLKKI